ncbi:FMN-binding protein [Candidatus Desantisbacteria bacterium]|nr:FMN-binding protein [Candidatus Desantisbacteria bacterium]
MKSAFRILIFVIIMGTVSGVLLIGVNSYTSIFIAKNDELKLKSSILDALEISYEKSKVIDIFNSQIQVLNKSNHTFYIASDKSIAFEFHGPGLWGPISGIISLEKDLKTIRKLKITYQEETPGLGGRIRLKAEGFWGEGKRVKFYVR